MPGVAESSKMAKKPKPEGVKRDDTTMKVDRFVAERARIAASFKGLSLSEYVSEILRPIVNRDIQEGYRKMEATDRKG